MYEHTPSTLIPETDQGIVLASVTMPDASSLDRTADYMSRLSKKIEEIPGVQYSTMVAGYDLLSSAVNTARGIIFINMKPWDQREISADQLVGKVMQLGHQVPGGSAMAFNMPPIMGLSTTGGLTGYLIQPTLPKRACLRPWPTPFLMTYKSQFQLLAQKDIE